MKRICGLCDEFYDDQNSEDVKIHMHHEPQSGVPRQQWLDSKMPYGQWIIETYEGKAWNAYINLMIKLRKP